MTAEENMQSVEKIMKKESDTDKEQALDLSLPPPNKNGEEIKLELNEEKGAHPKVKENQGTGPGLGQGHHPQFSNGAQGGSAEGSGPGLHVGQGHYPQFVKGAPGGSAEGSGPGLHVGQGHHPQFVNGAPGGSAEGSGPGLRQGHHPQSENGMHWGHQGGNYYNPQFQGPTAGVGAGNLFPGYHMGYPPYGSYSGASAGYGPGYPIMNPYPNVPLPYANPNMQGHYPGFQSGAPPHSYPGFHGGVPPHAYLGWGYTPPTYYPGGCPGFSMPWYPMAPIIMPGGTNWGPCNTHTLGNTLARREQEGCTWYEGGPTPNNTNAAQDRDMAQGQIITPMVQDRDINLNQSVHTGADQSESQIDSIPKTLTYNGTDNWDAFEMKFTSYALAKQWTPAQCREYLCWCLEGKASEFYTATLKRDAGIEMHDLIQKMKRRFGKSDLPETAQVKLGTLCQESDESLESWCDRVQSIALQAFENLPEEYVRKRVIYQICHGCLDKEAGQHVANLHLDNIQEALDRMKHFQYNHRVIFEREGREVEKVRNIPTVDLDSNVDGRESETTLFKAAKVKQSFKRPDMGSR